MTNTHPSDQKSVEQAPPQSSSVRTHAADSFIPTHHQITDMYINLSELRNELDRLNHQVVCLETLTHSLGDKALAMPEDLGDWSQANPRLSGLVNRILQTYQLAQQVRALKAEQPLPHS
ncbi:hypothetical protein BWQ96_06131 [Gracilariopsis chorda]|uniref:Uncharacterized protein n=1 Tax=Gracilariopsis chorda TaxID=448386 RepID=A0A2V3ISH0_9FLOR|nr:hypothetical protein BWQ96_06131 [Gracilariopsis chorda]|eukprot:PXF44050.1 hypothetical protein BWQ96_06131 [Gracilariopsis chorda]